MKTNLLITSLAFGATLGFSHAFAEGHHHALTDDIFAKKAAAGGLTEVELGKIAEQNGGSQEIKDFGAKMVDDHGKANDNLKAVAAKDSLTIPDKPNEEQQAMIDKLGKLTGKEFDHAYTHAMVKAHIQDKALFTEEIDSAKNPDLKQFAQDTLPVIKDHLSMIESIEHGKSMTAMHDSSGDSGAGKSGLAPGANANPAPQTNHPEGPASGAPETSGATHNVGDGGAGKSGLAPGANANPVPTNGTPQ
jgi:putative membrane protein